MSLLEIKDLVGGYTKTPVLKGISFDIQPNELVGLIGLNGAGKSTTIKHIIGLMEPKDGRLRLMVKPLPEDPDGYRKKFTYIPETPIFYDELTLEEHLRLTAMAYGIEETVYKERDRCSVKGISYGKKNEMVSGSFLKGNEAKGNDYVRLFSSAFALYCR